MSISDSQQNQDFYLRKVNRTFCILFSRAAIVNDISQVIILWALVLTTCIPAFMAHGLHVEHTSGDQFDKLIIIIIAQPYLLKAGNRVITFFEIFRQSLRRERKQCRKIDFILIMASYCLNFIKLFNCNVYFLQKCLFDTKFQQFS